MRLMISRPVTFYEYPLSMFHSIAVSVINTFVILKVWMSLNMFTSSDSEKVYHICSFDNE